MAFKNHESSASHCEAVEVVIHLPSTTKHIGVLLSEQYARENGYEYTRMLLKIEFNQILSKAGITEFNQILSKAGVTSMGYYDDRWEFVSAIETSRRGRPWIVRVASEESLKCIHLQKSKMTSLR